MKLIKMKVNRTANPQGGTHYEYPTPHYDAYKVAFGPIYEGGLPEGADIARGRDADDEFIVVGVKDVDAAQFLKAEGYVKDGVTYGASLISRPEAEALGLAWTKQTDKVTDQTRVNELLVKVGKGEELTQDEKDALNPEKSEVLGMGKSKSFKASLDESFVEEVTRIAKEVK